MEISKTSWHYRVWKNWYSRRNRQVTERITLCAYCRQLGWILFFIATAAVARTAWKHFIVPTFTTVFVLLGLIFNIWARCISVPLLLLIGFYPTREWLNLKFDAFGDTKDYWLPTVRGYRITPFAVMLVIAYIWATSAAVVDFRTNGWAVLSDKNVGNSVAGVVILMHMVALGVICSLGAFYLSEHVSEHAVNRFQIKQSQLKQKMQRPLHQWLAETAALLFAYLKALKQRVCPVIMFVDGED